MYKHPPQIYGVLSESPSEEYFTHAEIYVFRFQPQRQRHVLEDIPEASGRSEHEKEGTREAEL